uniref:uncharacterized protein LOC106999362 isoform X1 n=1 Tax=Macaca mulatta TaxID=9544 RepID=UPI0010A280F1|nr:uncharacterized protein LOC106999362 isoform X1 [Macaca mulatta]
MLDYALIGALSAAVVAEPAPVRGGCISAPLRRLLAPLSRPARGIAGLSMRAALPSRNCRKKGNLFMFKKRKVRNKKERNCPSSWQQKVLVMHFAASLQFSSMEGERKQSPSVIKRMNNWVFSFWTMIMTRITTGTRSITTVDNTEENLQVKGPTKISITGLKSRMGVELKVPSF